MSEIVDFLLARYDEEERAAQKAANGDVPAVVRDGWLEQWTEHIAGWDPARVLAKVKADRLILDLHAGEHNCTEMRSGVYPPDWPADAPYGHPGERWTHIFAEHFTDAQDCPTVRALALPYADRPAYRDRAH